MLAGPEYRENNGREQWTPGDTIQAAIGQSDNLLTPLQLSVYMATIANGGSRYQAHLLHSVHDFADGLVDLRRRTQRNQHRVPVRTQLRNHYGGAEIGHRG